jgi:hypothetical protein
MFYMWNGDCGQVSLLPGRGEKEEIVQRDEGVGKYFIFDKGV